MSNLLLRFLAVSALVLVTSCAAGHRESGPSPLISTQEEQAQAVQLQRMAARFRWSQQGRLERVLIRLLLAMPDPPHLTVTVAPCDAVNAYVDGGQIHVCLGMLRFATSDDELAVVLGHEMGHLPTSGNHGLLGGTSGTGEREADIRGLLYAHRAGYDIRGGAKVFERMAIELASGIGDGESGDHPSHAERMLLAEKIARLLEESRGVIGPAGVVERLREPVSSFEVAP